MPRLLSTLALLFVLGFSITHAHAENWPNWRGPTNNGLSQERGIAITWSASKNVLWKTPLPGPAGASPVVWDQQIFLTTVDNDGGLWLLALGKDGKEQWRKKVGQGNQAARGDEGNSASPSPVTDGKHVWSFMGTGDLACFTLKGDQVWAYNVQDRYGKFDIQFGMSSTPVLYGDRLYLQLIHGDGDVKTTEARVVALEKTTGKEVWAVGRPSDGHSENEHSYASPVIYDDGQQAFLLTHGNDYAVAHDLENGKELWRVGGLNLKSKYDPTLRFVASPSVVKGQIVIPTAKGGPVVAVKPGFQGDITEQAAANFWRFPKTPDVPSPLIHDGLVYLCMQDGNLHTLDAQSGAEVYPVQRTERQRHRASPVMADGHLYLTARNGVVNVIKAGRKFEVVATNDLGEDTSASPAISGGRIYFRTFTHLWAIGTK